MTCKFVLQVICILWIFANNTLLIFMQEYFCVLVWEMEGFPDGASGKDPHLPMKETKMSGFDPWVGKTPWRRTWQPTPVFWPGGSPWTEVLGGLQSIGLQRVGRNWSNLAH